MCSVGVLMVSSKKKISLILALIPIVFLISALFFTIVLFKQSAHIPLVLATLVAGVLASLHGVSWDRLLAGMIHGIHLAMGAVLILMVIGIMIGTWIISGVVPTMIYYGLLLLSPEIFLVATLLVCSIVSLGTGSSWSTAGTVGVALIAVGQGLGIPSSMVAGAIISGAYLGDKMSPLSDTTNLAPAVAGTDVFTHIRHMVFTTGPGYLLAMALYAVLGAGFSSDNLNTGQIEVVLGSMESQFTLSPLLFLPPVLVIIMVVRRIPPLPALITGAIVGGLLAVLMQDKALEQVFLCAYSGYESTSGVKLVDELLTRGGLKSMMDTVALIICALAFGGLMEKTGMLATIANGLLKIAKSSGSLVATTIFSCIAMNIFAAEQYMAIVIPGRMYKQAYEKLGLHPKNLSRALEDSATMTSSLIPWNSCGAFMQATLAVNPLAYLPFAFLNLASPIISLFYGFTGITIEKLKNTGEKPDSKNEPEISETEPRKP